MVAWTLTPYRREHGGQLSLASISFISPCFPSADEPHAGLLFFLRSHDGPLA